MINTVLFDLDGTIIDTNELIISSFLHVLEQLGPGALPREEIIPHMGGTLEQQMQAFTGKTDVAEYVTGYRAYNAIHHDAMVNPFPNVTEVCEELRKQGIRMGVVTTKIRPSTLKVLEMYDLKKYMEVIVTVTDVTHPKPHPEPVQKAVEELGADPASTLMVGDSPVDIQSAKAAGVLAAGVAWSLKGEAKLREYGPDYILHDMNDILTIIQKEQ
ncbi:MULTISPECIES: pyrophosphatase PpaX [unclassified Paenibacillus]|uniref:pyrophosphatase PpaX n=1 Tax=unclassified Paenibacillus TaxID=185978 RepID=UPI00089D3ED6|nr:MULTISPECIES: pyrophosphatase PpaX [unclassified Paenibacillus]OMC63426.1 pyrophosphatase PpaX [Paenibacillus sp. FSL H7-0326]SDX79658.1 pyrophosphatase PpaX [Paenibacillus sp. PDC88]